MSVKHGAFCLNERIAIIKAIKDSVLETGFILSIPGTLRCFRSHRVFGGHDNHCDIIAKASECKAYTYIGKKVKLVIPHSKWSPLPNCVAPNEELQVFCGGSITNEGGNGTMFLNKK